MDWKISLFFDVFQASACSPVQLSPPQEHQHPLGCCRSSNVFDKYIHTLTIRVWNPTRNTKKCKGKKIKINFKKEENQEKEKNQTAAVCDVAQPEEVIASLHMSHCSERRWRKCDVKGGKHTGAHCAQDKK